MYFQQFTERLPTNPRHEVMTSAGTCDGLSAGYGEGRVTIRDPVLCSVTFFRSVNLTHIVTNLSQMESLHNEPVVSTPPETFFR